MNPLNSAPPMLAFLRQALTVLSILFLCVTPTHAACRRISYTSQPHCEEALGNDMVNRPPCSTLNFTVQVIPCELRTSADLVALRAANYRVLPNIPVRLSLTNSDVVKVVDISNSLCWSFSKKNAFFYQFETLRWHSHKWLELFLLEDCDPLILRNMLLVAWWRQGPLLLTWFNFNPIMDK